MKLYKILENIILEESAKAKILLAENVADSQVIDAINGKYNVNIVYDDPDTAAPSKRYIQVYNFAETTAGNKAIRAFQIFGGSKTTLGHGAWKIFRLDRIREWHPTKVKFARPVSDKGPNIPKYNPNGDRTMSRVFNKVDFNKPQQNGINTSTSRPQ